jgi:hypothetical protein
MWCLPIYFFLLWFPLKGIGAYNRFREGSRSVKDFCVLIDITGSDPAVSLKRRDPFQWHRWIRFRDLIETTESFTKMSKSDPAVSLTPWDLIPRSHWNHRKRSRGLIETAGSDTAVSWRPRNPNFTKDYLDFINEYEAICETALARESGPYGGLFDEKIACQKSCDTVYLSEQSPDF